MKKLKQKRNISGVYYRHKVGDKWENRVFEDMPEAEQDRIMDSADLVYLKSLCKIMANSLYDLAEYADIVKL